MKYLIKYLNILKKGKEKLEKQEQHFLAKVKNLFGNLDNSGGNILTLSKESINASINENFDIALSSLKGAQKEIIQFDKILFKARRILGGLLTDHKLKAGDLQNVYQRLDAFEKDFSAAKEEFFEAKILYFYLKDNKRKILGPTELPLADFEAYAGALSDFCGELIRKARLCVVKSFRCESDIGKYLRNTQDIYQSLANFAFSNKSGLRQKIEHLKNYIVEFEKLLYDSKLRR